MTKTLNKSFKVPLSQDTKGVRFFPPLPFKGQGNVALTATARAQTEVNLQVKPLFEENKYKLNNLGLTVASRATGHSTSVKQTKMMDIQHNNNFKENLELSKKHLVKKKLEYVLESGLNLGHKSLKFKSAWHSSLSKFLLGSRNNSAILKNNLTLIYFIRALYILTLIIKAGGNILIINTNPQFSILLQQMRKNTNSSQILYSDCYWTGGTLTNWAQVSKSINTFIDFYNRFDDFLSKNQINFPRYKKMKKKFKGFIIKSSFPKKNSVSNLGENFKTTHFDKNWKPDLVFFLNSTGTEAIIKEACILQIPIIALVDSNINISNITYPIPTNHDSFPFAQFCLNFITKIANKKINM
jgi:small subunit ribosomal protein S2